MALGAAISSTFISLRVVNHLSAYYLLLNI